MKTELNLEERLTEQQVAELYCISLSWLQKHRRPGMNGPIFYKVDPDNPRSSVRYKRGDCEKFFNRGKIDPRAA